MKYFAIICLLTFASAIQSRPRHVGPDIYKRTLPKSNAPSRSTTPNKQPERALQRTNSLQRTQSLDRTKSTGTSGSVGKQEDSRSVPRLTGVDQLRDSSRSSSSRGLISRPGLEAIHSGNGIGHPVIPPLGRENPLLPQGLPRDQTPNRSHSGTPRQGSQSVNAAGTGSPRPGGTEAQNPRRLNEATRRTDAHFTTRPTQETMSRNDNSVMRNDNPVARNANSMMRNGGPVTRNDHPVMRNANSAMMRNGNPVTRNDNSVMRTGANNAASWVGRNPTAAIFGGCAAAGTCLAGAGIGMLATGAISPAAGFFTTGIGGGVAAGMAAAGAVSYISNIDGDIMARPMGMHGRMKRSVVVGRSF